MNDTQSYSESLLGIVQGIELRTIMLPEFQRDFRWEMEQTYDLFDSLIREIFVGTIIYGKPAFAMTLREIDKRPRRGKGSNASLPTESYTDTQIKQLAQTQNLRVVLDGQQRLTSVFRAITGLDAVYVVLKRDLISKEVEVLNKLTLEEMLEEVSGEDQLDAISVKLHDAYKAEKQNLDQDELDEQFEASSFAQKQLKDVSPEILKKHKKIYRLALKRVMDLYKQQKLLSYYLLDMSLDKFCTFFERSNSRGIQLDFTDILAAKLYHGFNLRKEIETFESESQLNLKLNREVIVRSIAYIVAKQQGKQVSIARKFILENLQASDFTQYWAEVCQLYVKSLGYLSNQHFILSQNWMPSENMVIPLMMFLREVGSFDSINEEKRQFIEWWYWTSVMANRYSTSSNETIINDCEVLVQVARGERIKTRGFFVRMRPQIAEPEDLFSYTKKSSTIYRGLLNMLGYTAKGLMNWNNTQKIDVTMSLEDHHIYPRAYLASTLNLTASEREDATQLVDCVVNRTLIPKLLNIKIGKKAPHDYLVELRDNQNPQLAECIKSHLLPEDLLTDEAWNSLFKLFLEGRAQSMFDNMERLTTARTADILALHGGQTDEETVSRPGKPRLKDLITSGKVQIGERVFTKKRPDCFATIVDGDTIEFEGKHESIINLQNK